MRNYKIFPIFFLAITIFSCTTSKKVKFEEVKSTSMDATNNNNRLYKFKSDTIKINKDTIR